jgi:hypothetical protein
VKVGNIIEINLTTQERDLIVNNTFADPALIEPLEERPAKDNMITVYYSPENLEELLGFIAAEANHKEDKNLGAALDSLHDKLADILDAYEEPE